MSNQSQPAWLNQDAQPDREPWRRVKFLVPRVGLLMTGHGVRTRILWPGRYDTRMSIRFNRPIYRQV
jgi:hypothetical protein